MLFNSWMRILLVFDHVGIELFIEGSRQQCHWKIVTSMSLERFAVNPNVNWELKYLIIGETKIIVK